MKIRLPECDEQPVKLKIANHFTVILKFAVADICYTPDSALMAYFRAAYMRSIGPGGYISAKRMDS